MLLIYFATGNNPNLNRFVPENLQDLIEWDFLAKSIFSASHTNPKQKMESSLREGIDDVIREIMENINTYSRQRGRVIDYREVLYGYSRVNSLYGHDLVLDLLLVYKKYRGKKMTVPVRKHLYIQRSFTETRIREIASSESGGIVWSTFCDYIVIFQSHFSQLQQIIIQQSTNLLIRWNQYSMKSWGWITYIRKSREVRLHVEMTKSCSSCRCQDDMRHFWGS